jgi:hypothetical protein
VRIFVAILVGLITASLTCAAGKAIGVDSVWPGAIFGFVFSALAHLFVTSKKGS